AQERCHSTVSKQKVLRRDSYWVGPMRSQKRHPRVDERYGVGDRMPPGRDLLMKQWPCMNHVWPYLQCDRHVGGPSDLGPTDRLVEQCLRRTHLNQERRQPVETCVDWRSQWREGIDAGEKDCSQH